MPGPLLLALLPGLLITGLTGRACGQDGFVPQARTLTFNVFDQSGKSFVNPLPDVAGTPFLARDWQYGTLVVNTSRRYDSVRVRLNLYSQQVHFLNSSNLEVALDKGYIREVLLPDPKTGIQGVMHFRNGFPPIDAQDADNFYQVLDTGKIWLLLSIRKIIAQDKDEMSAEVRKEYRAYEDYYIYDGKTMQRIRKDKTFVENMLADKKEKVAGFVEENKLRLKSIDEIRRVIEYYNTL
jgi:hypothetical protein